MSVNYLVFIIIGAPIFIFIIYWLDFLRTTVKNSTKYGWGTYKLFRHYFKQNELCADKNGRFAHYSSRSYATAEIIMFNNIGMLLNPIDFVRALFFCLK